MEHLTTPPPWTWRTTSNPDSAVTGAFLRHVRLGGGGPGGHLRVGMIDLIQAADARLITLCPELLALAVEVARQDAGPLAAKARMLLARLRPDPSATTYPEPAR